jgi:uncharacterized small protein (DUF1192 family)
MNRSQLRSIAKRLDNAERCPTCGHRRNRDEEDLSRLTDEELEARIADVSAKINALAAERQTGNGVIPHEQD